MYGLRPVVPQPLLRDSFPSRLLAAGPVELPHMLYTGPTCSTHQGAGVLLPRTDTFHPSSRDSLSFGPSFPAQTSTAAAGSILKREAGSCNLTATASFTATLNCKTSCIITGCWSPVWKRQNSGYATVRCDRLTGGGDGGLVTLVHHSVPYRVPDMTYSLMMTRRKF